MKILTSKSIEHFTELIQVLYQFGFFLTFVQSTRVFYDVNVCLVSLSPGNL